MREYTKYFRNGDSCCVKKKFSENHVGYQLGGISENVYLCVR